LWLWDIWRWHTKFYCSLDRKPAIGFGLVLKRGLHRRVDGVFGHSLKFNGIRQLFGNHFHDAPRYPRHWVIFSEQNNPAGEPQKQGRTDQMWIVVDRTR